MEIRTIFWKNGAVVMIDQKALPLEERTLICTRYEEVVAAINDLTVRGAPAIGVAAAMGISLGARQLLAENPEAFQRDFMAICDAFARTRPTARNLFWAIERMKLCFEKTLASDTSMTSSGKEGTGVFFQEKIRQALVAEAIGICEEDIAVNRKMGAAGRSLIKDGDRILTHCNAGALATAGYGTALGVIRAACEEGKNVHVFVDETRPVLQGARLTAWELMKENIPATLITDNMAGFLMQRGKIDLVITGADRIALNGDTANKIGTYALAVLAKENNIPFYIAAPRSTIDLSVKTGNEIPIEERSGEEVVAFQGARSAPVGMQVYNPAFDVTPHRYITAIITESGVIRPPFEKNLPGIFPV
ncbi:MAG: S-methyl-5-thioribose-1-phosphate isomerase [Syntrophus sp. (in: bacteria)]|nr:S-methyl-5-thioribose-1-phosphate isomerase [Syntrophus sp. (in: bacteria)]